MWPIAAYMWVFCYSTNGLLKETSRGSGKWFRLVSYTAEERQPWSECQGVLDSHVVRELGGSCTGSQPIGSAKRLRGGPAVHCLHCKQCNHLWGQANERVGASQPNLRNLNEEEVGNAKCSRGLFTLCILWLSIAKAEWSQKEKFSLTKARRCAKLVSAKEKTWN